LYEIQSPSGREFGLDALLSCAARCIDKTTTELFSSLLADALGFAAKEEFNDEVRTTNHPRAVKRLDAMKHAKPRPTRRSFKSRS